jgi:hypothetical protein
VRLVRSRPARRDPRRPRPLPVAPVTRLTLNHAAGALPLGTRRVRFGWQLTDVPAVVAVQVVVAGTPDEARAGAATVWDSGRRTTDDPTFSDLCLTAPLGSGRDAVPLRPEVACWWAVRVWDVDGGAYDWSEPSRLLVSAVVAPASAPRMLAWVEGSLPTTAAQPVGDEGLYRRVTTQDAAAVWPLVCSVDVASRVGGWLDRLRPQLDPGDRHGLAVYAALLEAADLCYDDPDLRAVHGPALAALQQRTGRLQPVRATSGVRADGRFPTFAGPPFETLLDATPFVQAPFVAAPLSDHPYTPTSFAGPTSSAAAGHGHVGGALTDVLAPLLGSSGASSSPLPVGIVVSEVAGLRATAPGFRRFRVEPCLLPQATEVDVEVETARGSILVRLRRRPDTLAGAQVTLGVPSGAVAKLVLPWSGEEVTLDAGSYVFVND